MRGTLSRSALGGADIRRHAFHPREAWATLVAAQRIAAAIARSVPSISACVGAGPPLFANGSSNGKEDATDGR